MAFLSHTTKQCRSGSLDIIEKAFFKLRHVRYTPHNVKHLYFYGTDRPNYWVDISSTLDRQLAALHLHSTQIQGFEDEFIRRRAIQAGATYQYTYAEAFHHF